MLNRRKPGYRASKNAVPKKKNGRKKGPSAGRGQKGLKPKPQKSAKPSRARAGRNVQKKRGLPQPTT